MIDVNSLSSEQQKGIKYIDLPSSIALFLDNKYLGSTSVPKEGGKLDIPVDLSDVTEGRHNLLARGYSFDVKIIEKLRILNPIHNLILRLSPFVKSEKVTISFVLSQSFIPPDDLSKPHETDSGGTFYKGELIIDFTPEITLDNARKILHEQGGFVLGYLASSNAYLVTFENKNSSELNAIAEQFMLLPSIEGVTKNYFTELFSQNLTDLGYYLSSENHTCTDGWEKINVINAWKRLWMQLIKEKYLFRP